MLRQGLIGHTEDQLQCAIDLDCFGVNSVDLQQQIRIEYLLGTVSGCLLVTSTVVFEAGLSFTKSTAVALRTWHRVLRGARAVLLAAGVLRRSTAGRSLTG